MKRGTKAGGTQHAAAGLTLFTESELAEIHRGSLEVLERTGIWVEADDALDLYADGGCRVDRETHIVKIPGGVAEEALSAIPPRFRLYARDPRNDVEIGGSASHFVNFGVAVRVNDRVTGENREPVKSDVVDAARLIDWCSEIDVLLESVVPSDTTTPALHMLDVNLRNSTKPVITGPQSPDEMEACLDLLAVACGGRETFAERPPALVGGGIVSPLQLCKQGSDNLLSAARLGLPVAATAMVMAGGSGPQTLAGTLVQHNAEVLACATLVQLANRGNPVILASSSLALDLRYGAAVLGNPEGALINAGVAQLAHMHGVPCWIQGL
jgi:trimethylamine--corrinoid protein Co-methyltransferase